MARACLTFGSWLVPTPEMYVYAAKASVGDDVYHEPCTKALEAHIAKITGKEAGMFVPSGTMSNQIALRTHLQQPPYSVLCDHRSHIVRYSSVVSYATFLSDAAPRYEAGGLAFHSGAHAQMVVPSNGNATRNVSNLIYQNESHTYYRSSYHS